MADSKRVAAVKRFAKVVAAVVLGAAAGWVVGPDVADVVGTQNAVIVSAILIPLISAAQKALGEQGGPLDPKKNA